MIRKVADYKGVIIFYLLLGLGLFALTCHNRIYDNRIAEMNNIIANN